MASTIDFVADDQGIDFQPDETEPKKAVPGGNITSIPAALKAPIQAQRQLLESGDAGMQAGTGGSEELASQVLEHPKALPGSIASLAMAPMSAATEYGKRAIADVSSAAFGMPEYGGNLNAPVGQPLPIDKFLASTARYNPTGTTAAKLALAAPGMLATSGVGLPGLAGKLVSAGFAADMITKAPQLARDIGTELGKNPGERDQDKLTTLISDAIQTGVFAPMAGFHASRDTIMRYADKPHYLAEQVAKQLAEADLTPQAKPQFGLSQLGIPTPQIPSTASQLPVAPVEGEGAIPGFRLKVPPEKIPSRQLPALIGEPPPRPAGTLDIDAIKRQIEARAAQSGGVAPPDVTGLPAPIKTAEDLIRQQELQRRQAGGPSVQTPSPLTPPETTPLKTAEEARAARLAGKTVPPATTEQVLGEEPISNKIIPQGPEEERSAHDQVKDFITVHGAKPFEAPITEEAGGGKVVFEQGGPGEKKWKATVYDPEGEVVHDESGTFLQTLVRNVHEDFGVDFANAEHGEVRPLEESEKAPEYKQGLADNARANIRKVLDMPLLFKKGDAHPVMKELEDVAGKLGVPFEIPAGPFDRDAYRSAVMNLLTKLEKKYGETKGKKYAEAIRGDQRQAEERGNVAERGKVPRSEDLQRQAQEQPGGAGLPREGQAARQVSLTKQAGEEPPVRTAEHGFEKPMGAVTHDEIRNMPDAELIKYMTDADEAGHRYRPPHKDGISYGMKFDEKMVPELQKLVDDSEAKAKAAIESGDDQAFQANYGRMTWAMGAIEGALKKGPNYDMDQAMRRMSTEERVAEESENGAYGSEWVDQRIIRGLRNGISARDTLQILSETSTEAGKLAAEILKHGDPEGLNVMLHRDVQAKRSYYDGDNDHIMMAGIRQFVPALEVLHEINHGLIERKIPAYMTHLGRPEFRGSGYIEGLRHLINDKTVSPGIRSLAETFQRAIEAFPDKRLKDVIGNADLVKTMGMPYGMGNLSEFISEAISRKSFQQMLDEMPGIYGKKTLWQNFIEGVRSVLGLPAKAYSLLNDFFQSYPKAISERRPAFDEPAGVKYASDPIKTFGEKDLKPFLEKTVDAAKAAPKLLAKMFSPETLARPGDMDILFKSKGDKEKFLTQAAAALDGVHTMFEKMPDKDRIAFIDRMKTGQPQPTPELKQAAALFREWDDRLYDEVTRFKPDLNYLENHFRSLWKVIPGSPEAEANLAKRGLTKEQIASKRPARGSMGFLRQHVLKTLSEGIAMGGVPVTTNPLEMFTLHAQDAMKYVAANQAWEGLKSTGAVQFVKRGERPPPGFVRIEDSIAKAYFRTPEGLISSNGEWWANDGVGRMFNNYLSRDYIRQGSEGHPELGVIGRGALALKNATTNIELGLSPFHAVFETNEAVGSNLGLGFRKILAGKGLEGVKDVGKALLVEPAGLAQVFGAKAPRESTAGLGDIAIQFAKNSKEFQKNNPDAYNWFVKNYPQAKELIDDLFTGGGQIAMNEDYRVRGINGYRKAIAEIKSNWSDNPIGSAARGLSVPFRAVLAANEVAMKPLFQTYIPRLKVGMFLKEYSFELEQRSRDLQMGKITRGQLARQTWASIEDRFGELNWDNLYWNRTFKTAMQLAFRSVTWKLGNIRAFGKAIRDTTAELGVNWWKEGRAPRMTQSMGWLLGMSIITAMQASVISKVTTGKYPWELAKDLSEQLRNIVFPRIDPIDPSQRVSIPTYWKDLVHAEHDPVDYVKSSMTGEIGRLWDTAANRDFYGVQVYNPDDPLYKRALDVAGHLIPKPFGVSSQIAAHRTGASGLRALAGYAGFTKAPYYMSYSPAELKLSEFIRNHQPIGSKTKEVFERGVNERIAVDALRRKEMTMSEAIKKGLVLPRRREEVLKRTRLSHLVYGISSPEISPDEAMKVYQLSTPAERKEIRPIVRTKIENSHVKTGKEKRALFKELDALK